MSYSMEKACSNVHNYKKNCVFKPQQHTPGIWLPGQWIRHVHPKVDISAMNIGWACCLCPPYRKPMNCPIFKTIFPTFGEVWFYWFTIHIAGQTTEESKNRKGKIRQRSFDILLRLGLWTWVAFIHNVSMNNQSKNNTYRFLLGIVR